VRIADGVAIAPERPGHGVALDFKALAKLKA
jgi:L-alanine-DL-glutamate epimerase-like enolase superfamily enzyme